MRLFTRHVKTTKKKVAERDSKTLTEKAALKEGLISAVPAAAVPAEGIDIEATKEQFQKKRDRSVPVMRSKRPPGSAKEEQKFHAINEEPEVEDPDQEEIFDHIFDDERTSEVDARESSVAELDMSIKRERHIKKPSRVEQSVSTDVIIGLRRR